MTYEAWRISYHSSEQAARAAYAECVQLRAKIEQMEQQEPMDSNYIELLDSAQKIVESYVYFRRDVAGTPLEHDIAIWMVDFVLAQPAPGVPDGWQLVPTAESRHPGIYKMLGALHAADNTPGMSEWESYRAMLAAAPEAKP